MTMIAPATAGAPPASAPAAMSMMTAAVQLKNEGADVFTMKYGPLDRLTLHPGQSVYVPEEVAWHFLGRWWTNNDDPRNRARVDEVRRLRTLYGAYEDDMVWEGIGVDPVSQLPRIPAKPSLVAYTADGNRITTVVDDPEGVAGADTQTRFGREQSMEAQLQILQQTVLQLQAQIGTQQAEAIDSIPEVAQVTEQAPAPVAPPMPPGVSGQAAQMVGGQVAVPVAPPSIPQPPSPGAVGLDLPVKAATEYDPIEAFKAMGAEEQQRVLQARLAAGLSIEGLSTTAGVPDDVPVDTPQKIPTGGRISAGS